MGKVVFVTGGTASGKSEYAEELAIEAAKACSDSGTVMYIATMMDSGSESEKRIERHMKMRERYRHVLRECFTCADLRAAAQAAGQQGCAAVLFDCLTGFTADVMFRDGTEGCAGADIEIMFEDIKSGIDLLAERSSMLIITADYIFGDGNHWEGDMKNYINLAGNVFRYAACIADEVIEVVCGIPVRYR